MCAPAITTTRTLRSAESTSLSVVQNSSSPNFV